MMIFSNDFHGRLPLKWNTNVVEEVVSVKLDSDE